MEKLILALPEEEPHRIPDGMNANEARLLAREGLRQREVERKKLVTVTLNAILKAVRQEASLGRFQAYYTVPCSMDIIAIDDLIHQLKTLGYGVVHIGATEKLSVTWSEK